MVVKDKEIIYIFDQNVNVVIEGLAKMSERPYEDILTLLKDRGNGDGNKTRWMESPAATDDAGGYSANISGGALVYVPAWS